MYGEQSFYNAPRVIKWFDEYKAIVKTDFNLSVTNFFIHDDIKPENLKMRKLQVNLIKAKNHHIAVMVLAPFAGLEPATL